MSPGVQPGVGLMGTTEPTATGQVVTTPVPLVPGVHELVAAELRRRDPQLTVAWDAPVPVTPFEQEPTSVVVGAGVVQSTVAPPFDELAVCFTHDALLAT